MRRLFAAALLALLALPATASSPQEVVTQAVQKSHKLRNFSVDYVYTITGSGDAQIRAGEAWFSGKRYLVRYDDIVYYSDGRYVWVQHNPVKRVFVRAVEDGRYYDIERVFDFDWSSGEIESFEAESDNYHVSIKLTDPDLFRAELWIRQGDGMIDQVILHDQKGRRHSYELGAYKRDRLPARDYRFSRRRNPGFEELWLVKPPEEDI